MDWVLFCIVVTPPCGYWIKSSMTDRSGNDGRVSPLSLWIADQARNDVGFVGGGCSAWRCAPPCGFPLSRNDLAPRSYPAGTQRGLMDLQDWGDATHRFHPLIPVSDTGTGLSPLPSRERGFCRLFCLLAARPVDTGSSPV